MNLERHVWYAKGTDNALDKLVDACRAGQPALARYHAAQLILDGTPDLCLERLVVMLLEEVSLAHLGLLELAHEATRVLRDNRPESKAVRTVLFRFATAMAYAPRCHILQDAAAWLLDECAHITPQETEPELRNTMPSFRELLQKTKRDDLEREQLLLKRVHLSLKATWGNWEAMGSAKLMEYFLDGLFRKHPLGNEALQETAQDLRALCLAMPQHGHLWLLFWSMLYTRPLSQLVVDELVRDEPENCQEALDHEIPHTVKSVRRAHRSSVVVNDYQRSWVTLKNVPACYLEMLLGEHIPHRIVRKPNQGRVTVMAHLLGAQKRVFSANPS